MRWDYVITVKKNQPKLHEAITEQFGEYFDDDLQDKAVRSHKQVSRDRGRLAERTVTVAPVPSSIKAMKKWTNIKTIGMVRRHREAINKDNPRAIKETDHVTYFISSLPPTASLVAKHVSKHWTVENKLPKVTHRLSWVACVALYFLCSSGTPQCPKRASREKD